MNTGDSIMIAGDLIQHGWGVSSPIGTIAFGDGPAIVVGLTGNNEGQPLTFTWNGTASNTVLSGSDYGTNVFDLAPGNDTVTFGNSRLGGSGANMLSFEKGDGQVHVALNGSTGTIRMASDIAESDVILQSDAAGDLIVKLRDTGDSITVQADLTKYWWGVTSQIGQIVFGDGSAMAVGQAAWHH